MAIRPSALFFLPNTTTVLARSAINLLRAAPQPTLDEAIQTLINRSLSGPAVMTHLEQSVSFSEVLEKLAVEWSDETVRAFAAAFVMEPAKRDVMDIIVAIAILNEADLEAELRGENTQEATPADLLENRRVTWQHPPPGTLLNPPYVVLVAVERVDATKADGEVQSILGVLVDYKGYKIPRRMTIPLGALTGIKFAQPDANIRPEILSAIATAAAPTVIASAASSPAPVVESPKVLTQPVFSEARSAAVAETLRSASRFLGGLNRV